MKSRPAWLQIVLVCFTVYVCVSSVEPSRHTRKTYMLYIDKTLKALDKLIGFYDEMYQEVNLDGVFGLRVAEGALQKTLLDEKAGKLHIDNDMRRRVLEVKKKAGAAAEKALPFLKKANLKYFSQFKKTVVAPWPNFKQFQKLDYDHITMPALDKKDFIDFDEHVSDKCLTEMTGTQKGNKNTKPCTISDECWKLETEGMTSGYALTHQGLYLLLGEVQGCQKEIKARLKKSNIKGGTNEVYKRMCVSMYPQMTKFEKTKDGFYTSEENRDLYMEQAMVCGTMGFSDFLSIKRLNDILSWQMKEGCFGSNEELKKRRLQKVVDEEMENNNMKMKRESQEGHDDIRISRKLMSKITMRQLLLEKDLKDGCMSHITGVASGVLGIYLRWLLYSVNPRPAVNDPVYAQEQGIDSLMENDVTVPKPRDQIRMMRRRSVLQEKPVKIAEIPSKQHSTSVLSWKIVFLVSFVVVWLVSLRFKYLWRMCVGIVMRKMKANRPV